MATCLCTTAYADLFKCTAGKSVVYQEIPCSTGTEKAMDDTNRRMYQRETAEQTKVNEDNSKNAAREASALAEVRVGYADNGARRVSAENGMREYFNRILIDPTSVQFREVVTFIDVPGSKLRPGGSKSTPLVDVVCGQVNSKNRMGGYVGFKHFYWDSDSKKVYGLPEAGWEGMAAEMEALARSTCATLK